MYVLYLVLTMSVGYTAVVVSSDQSSFTIVQRE